MACSGFQTLAVVSHDAEAEDTSEHRKGYKAKIKSLFLNKDGPGNASGKPSSSHAEHSAPACAMLRLLCILRRCRVAAVLRWQQLVPASVSRWEVQADLQCSTDIKQGAGSS